MNDSISRQAAIDIVVFECDKWTGLAKEISKQLRQLPSAQPDHIAEVGKKVDADLISRQEAIDALDCINGVEEVLRSLPPAKPEIINCKNCRHYMYYEWGHCGWCNRAGVEMEPDDYCSRAERIKDD